MFLSTELEAVEREITKEEKSEMLDKLTMSNLESENDLNKPGEMPGENE